MGAIEIEVHAKGVSMKNAFDNAVDQAIYDYGHDLYNGAINNCDLTKDVTKEYLKAEDQELFINELENKVSKREVYGIHLGNDEYLFIGSMYSEN